VGWQAWPKAAFLQEWEAQMPTTTHALDDQLLKVRPARAGHETNHRPASRLWLLARRSATSGGAIHPGIHARCGGQGLALEERDGGEARFVYFPADEQPLDAGVSPGDGELMTQGDVRPAPGTPILNTPLIMLWTAEWRKHTSSSVMC
jgi:hypothetical protein